jgi:predicted RNase H-like nuclease (RuvC/YqgF family)
MQLEELEAEVRKARRENRDLQDQLAAKTQEAAALQSEAAVWKSIKETERNNMMQTNTQLNQQLSEQILRAKTLEGQLSHTQADLVGDRGAGTGRRQSTSTSTDGMILDCMRTTGACRHL